VGTLLTTADLPRALRADPVREAVRQARPIPLPRSLATFGPCQHTDEPLRGQRCPECVAEAAGAQ
jgi:hypothetical protein